MNKLTNVLTAAAASMLAGVGQADTAPMTTEQYQAARERFESEYRAELKRCSYLSGHQYDVCRVEAKARRMRADVQTEAAYRKTRSARYEQEVTDAEADYLIARQKCEALAREPKRICLADAKAARDKAKAEASGQRQSDEAHKQMREVQSQADAAKRESDYKIDVGRCGALSAVAKDNCVARVKRIYGKS